MPTLPSDYTLQPGDRANPFVWVNDPLPLQVPEYDDTVMAAIYGDRGRSQKLRSWGHDNQNVHWLTTRGGTTMHTDAAYARYTHHLVFRNDGFRIRGLHDENPDMPQIVPGHLYCLDTHSPHQVVVDARFGTKPVYKLQLAVDTHEPLQPREALALLTSRWGEHPLDTLDTLKPTPPRTGKKAG